MEIRDIVSEEILEYFRTTINDLYINYCKDNNIDEKSVEKKE